MLALLLLAMALASDAFAVALARGACGEHRLARALETGLAFGAAQAIMPAIGWALGSLVLSWIAAIDHWIAFVLLGVLGLRMIREGLSDEEDDATTPSAAPRLALLAAAIATSIDAAAAGLTLELFAVPVALACLIIGLVTAGLCVPAYWFAARLGPRFGRGAEIGGGAVLLMLGLNILASHMGWA